jgi:hypothetical protein
LGHPGRQRQQDDGKSHIGVVPEFLNNCPAFVRLFTQDRHRKFKLFDEARTRLQDSFIVSMDQEDAIASI